MPIYEYECEDCGKKVEILHKRFGQEESITCPDCGSNKMRKLVSLPFINTNSPLDVAKKKPPTPIAEKKKATSVAKKESSAKKPVATTT